MRVSIEGSWRCLVPDSEKTQSSAFARAATLRSVTFLRGAAVEVESARLPIAGFRLRHFGLRQGGVELVLWNFGELLGATRAVLGYPQVCELHSATRSVLAIRRLSTLVRLRHPLQDLGEATLRGLGAAWLVVGLRWRAGNGRCVRREGHPQRVRLLNLDDRSAGNAPRGIPPCFPGSMNTRLHPTQA